MNISNQNQLKDKSDVHYFELPYIDLSCHIKIKLLYCHNRVCDCQKVSLNSHHEDQYLDVTTTFTNFNSFTTFLTLCLSYFEIANQIYDENVAQAIRNMEMISNSLKSATLKLLF